MVTETLNPVRSDLWSGPRHIVAMIEDIGFEAEACPPGGQLVSPSVAIEQELASWFKSLMLSLAFTVPVFFLSMVLPMLPGTAGFREASVWGTNGFRRLVP